VDWEKNRRTIFHAEFSNFVDVDGTRIHYQEAGNPADPPVLLIHGFSSSTLVWSRVFLRLAQEGFRVIAIDMLGHGYSDKGRNLEYTIKSQARTVTRVLDGLRISQASIVGSSYGGAVAATCALDYPERVSHLVMVGAVTNNDPTRFALLRLFSSP